MNRKIIYIYNPISGAIKKNKLIGFLKKENDKLNWEYEIRLSDKKGNYNEIKSKLETEKITDVVIIGGDGTANQVINALRNKKLRFGILPFGSGNGLANAAGIPKSLSKAFELIVSGASKPVDAFLINSEFSCMLSGLGLDARVAHDFAAKNSRGLTTYVTQTILNFLKAKPYKFEITVNGVSFFTDAFFISIANGNQFGNNVIIAPKASLNDGLLDVVVVQKMHKLKLLFSVLHQMNNRNKLLNAIENIPDNNIIYFQTSAFTIRNIDDAPLHIDGDPKPHSKEFKIELIKNCFELIMP